MAPYKSRAKRLSEAEINIMDARTQIEELRDELQNWFDNLPENLQSSNKADMLETAIDQLEQIVSDLDSIDFSVDFPNMYS